MKNQIRPILVLFRLLNIRHWCRLSLDRDRIIPSTIPISSEWKSYSAK